MSTQECDDLVARIREATLARNQAEERLRDLKGQLREVAAELRKLDLALKSLLGELACPRPMPLFDAAGGKDSRATLTGWLGMLSDLAAGSSLCDEDWPDDAVLKSWHAEGLAPQQALDRLLKLAEEVTPPPGPALALDLGEPHGGPAATETDLKLRLALDLLPIGLRDRWRAKRVTDTEIRRQLGSWWGHDGRRAEPASKPGGYWVRGGPSPALWIGDLTPRGKGGHKRPAGQARPTLQGPYLLKRVREVGGYPKPPAKAVLAAMAIEDKQARLAARAALAAGTEA